MQFFIINFEETTFDYEFRFLFTFINFLKDQANDSWNNTKLIWLKANCVSRAHGPSLTWSSLTVGEDSSIVSSEASKNQVLDTSLKYFLLKTFLTKCGVESE